MLFISVSFFCSEPTWNLLNIFSLNICSHQFGKVVTYLFIFLPPVMSMLNSCISTGQQGSVCCFFTHYSFDSSYWIISVNWCFISKTLSSSIFNLIFSSIYEFFTSGRCFFSSRIFCGPFFIAFTSLPAFFIYVIIK